MLSLKLMNWMYPLHENWLLFYPRVLLEEARQLDSGTREPFSSESHHRKELDLVAGQVSLRSGIS